MIIEFLEEAEVELFEAAAWYESKETGLGKRFRNEVAHVLDRIVECRQCYAPIDCMAAVSLAWAMSSGEIPSISCSFFSDSHKQPCHFP